MGFTSLAIISLLFVFSCTPESKGPTSVIPERREFPINEKINPCDNYYEYACSKAIAGFKLRDDRSRHAFSFSDSFERILIEKKSYLKKLLTQKDFNVRSKQLHDNYAACMDTKSRSTEERDVLQKAIDEMNRVKTKEQFSQLLMTKSLQGHEGLVGSFNNTNLDDNNIYDFMVLPSRLASLPEVSYYQKKELMIEYQKLVTDFFLLTGSPASTENRAKAVIEFEMKFMNKYPTPAKRRLIWSQRNYTTKKKLLAMKSLSLAPLLDKVPSHIKIRNPMPGALSHLSNMIATEPLSVLKDVYLYQVNSDLLDHAYPSFFEKKFSFSHKFLGGAPKRADLDERCARIVMRSFDKEIDAELFDTFFPNFPEKKFLKTLELVRSSIIDGLSENKWLSATAKKNAIKKITMAKFQVVKPKTVNEWNFNPVATYNPKSYLGNKLILEAKKEERKFEKLAKPIDKTIWYMGPLTVNAYYDGSNNQFVMPAGILQYPFFDTTGKEWANLGAIGAVVGHELGHGVDDQGSKYDENGRLRQWMTDEDLKNFKLRGEKLVKQFNDVGHDGNLTLGENIGDLVGVTFALAAAQKIMPEGQKDEATKEFFLQYARAWCSVTRPKMKERLLKTDPHSLGVARVNEQMKHQAEFARVYQCKSTNKLVIPESERVKIW